MVLTDERNIDGVRLQCQRGTYKRLTSRAFNSLFICFEAASSCASIFFCAATLMVLKGEQALTGERDIDDIDGTQ